MHDIYCQLIPNDEEGQTNYEVVPRIGSFEVSCHGIVSKIYFCNLLIFDSYSFPSVFQDAGLIQKKLLKNVQIWLKHWIKVVISRNSKLLVQFKNKKLRELLSSHSPLKCLVLTPQPLQLLQFKHKHKLSQQLNQNQQLNQSLFNNKKRQKLSQLPLQQKLKLQKHLNQLQLLIISRNTQLLKVSMTSKLSLRLILTQLFLEI